jgi:hypothetical protein
VCCHCDSFSRCFIETSIHSARWSCGVREAKLQRLGTQIPGSKRFQSAPCILHDARSNSMLNGSGLLETECCGNDGEGLDMGFLCHESNETGWTRAVLGQQHNSDTARCLHGHGRDRVVPKLWR